MLVACSGSDAFWRTLLTQELQEALDKITQSNESLIRLAFRARKKLGLHGVTELRRAVGGITRQAVYRVLTPAEIQELQKP